MRMTGIVSVGLLAGCGLADLGRTVQGISEGDECSSSPGWVDARTALTQGQAGEPCTFGGGAGDGDRRATCFSGSLITQRDQPAPADRCGQPGPDDDLAPIAAGDCVRHCGRTSGVVGDQISCVDVPVLKRAGLDKWVLTDRASCDAMMTGCPRSGDWCSGTFVCQGQWPVGHPISGRGPGGGEPVYAALAWCADGSLRIAAQL